jgi:hypothetical protein
MQESSLRLGCRRISGGIMPSKLSKRSTGILCMGALRRRHKFVSQVVKYR